MLLVLFVFVLLLLVLLPVLLVLFVFVLVLLPVLLVLFVFVLVLPVLQVKAYGVVESLLVRALAPPSPEPRWGGGDLQAQLDGMVGSPEEKEAQRAQEAEAKRKAEVQPCCWKEGRWRCTGGHGLRLCREMAPQGAALLLLLSLLVFFFLFSALL